MLAVEKLKKAQQANSSHICLGLDLDPKKMPSEAAGSLKAMFDFAHAIIDATADLVCAYKPNLAFFENMGADGLALLKLIVERIPDKVPVILDGKRNDIGNSAAQYAGALFDHLKADWVTVNPYMGYDSLRPFIDRKDKGAFVLCLTSNPGSNDFQALKVDGQPLYKIVAERVNNWNKDNNCGLVVGATHPEQLADIRRVAGEMPILIPGVGAQGGSLEKAIEFGTDNFRVPAVINVSRSVLYASSGTDFAQRAREELSKLNAIVTRVRYGDQVPDKQGSQPSQTRNDSKPQHQRDNRHRDNSNRPHPKHGSPQPQPQQPRPVDGPGQPQSKPPAPPSDSGGDQQPSPQSQPQTQQPGPAGSPSQPQSKPPEQPRDASGEHRPTPQSPPEPTHPSESSAPETQAGSPPNANSSGETQSPPGDQS